MIRTWMPVAAGIISIVVGGLSLIVGFFVALAFTILYSNNYMDGTQFTAAAGAIIWAIFLPYLILCAVAIAGGVFSLRRRLWGLALAGTICSLIVGWWVWPAGVAAIVFVIISKNEFDQIIRPQEPPLAPPPQPPTVTSQ